MKEGKYILHNMKFQKTSCALEWYLSTVRVTGQELADVTLVNYRFLQFLWFHMCLWEWRKRKITFIQMRSTLILHLGN